MEDKPSDLQLYHHLKNEIANLTRLMDNANNRASRAKRKLEIVKQKQPRRNKARLLIELKFRGYLDWSLHRIASESCLCYSTIRDIVAEVKKSL